MKRTIFILPFLFGICFAQEKQKSYAATIQQQVWSLTDVMYHDVVNPPAAARFYSYSLLAGYEILSQLDPSASAFQSGLNQYHVAHIPVDPSVINRELAVLYGILETGRNIISCLGQE